jgi:hypothetical protein
MGLALVAEGIHLATQQAVAIALLVLGSGAVVFGSFSERLEGKQEIGAAAVKLNIGRAIQASDATSDVALTAIRALIDALSSRTGPPG